MRKHRGHRRGAVGKPCECPHHPFGCWGHPYSCKCAEEKIPLVPYSKMSKEQKNEILKCVADRFEARKPGDPFAKLIRDLLA